MKIAKMIPLALLFLGMSALLPVAASAQTGTLFVQGNNVGIGTASPAAPFHLVKSSPGNATMFLVENPGAASFELRNTSLGVNWFFQADQDGTFKFSRVGTGGAEIIVRRRLDQDGPTLFVDGSIQATNVVFSSSRALKSDFSPVEPAQILDKIARMPIQSWRYKTEADTVRHVGPMAEDFYSAFGLGNTASGISVSDAYGVALAAIQALRVEVTERDESIAKLKKEIGEIKAMLADLQVRP